MVVAAASFVDSLGSRKRRRGGGGIKQKEREGGIRECLFLFFQKVQPALSEERGV